MYHPMKDALPRNCLVLLMGDFNYPSIELDLLKANTEDQEFLDFTQDTYLTEHVDIPTRGGNT